MRTGAVLALLCLVTTAAGGLVINEVMPDSKTFGFEEVLDPGEGPVTVVADWVEIYNPGPEDADLSGLYLSDNCFFPTKWEIAPEAALTVPAGGRLVIWCPGWYRGTDDDGVPVPIPAAMAPFRLQAAGGWIGLYDRDGETLVDGFGVHRSAPDLTYGCAPDGNTESRGFLAARLARAGRLLAARGVLFRGDRSGSKQTGQHKLVSRPSHSDVEKANPLGLEHIALFF